MFLCLQTLCGGPWIDVWNRGIISLIYFYFKFKFLYNFCSVSICSSFYFLIFYLFFILIYFYLLFLFFQSLVGVAYFLKELHIRVIQHNLRIVSQYYKKITTIRLAQMVGLTPDSLEEHLSRLSEASITNNVISKNNQDTNNSGNQGNGLYVKIDRPRGVIDFQRPRECESVLSDWAGDVSKMLTLMETTCHLINRETMVYKV